jgi:hypothetical protein
MIDMKIVKVIVGIVHWYLFHICLDWWLLNDLNCSGGVADAGFMFTGMLGQ